LYFKKEKELLDLIKKQLDQKSASHVFTALDADGTLWPEDANYHLMKYQNQTAVRDLEEILKLHFDKKYSRSKLCRFFAKKQAGFELEELKGCCQKALKTYPLHVFSFQRKLLEYLKQKNIQIVVVTASLKYIVEQAVQLYDLPVDKVLGVENQLKGQ